MKKIIISLVIILVVATVALFAFTKQAPAAQPAESTTDTSDEALFIQYCIYAPESADVKLDGKQLAFNENINCFVAEIEKEAEYTLTISQDGCEPIEEKVSISPDSREYTAELSYTQDYIDEAKEKGIELLDAIVRKCWNLDYILTEYNFLSEDEQLKAEELLADIVSELEENLSAEYKTGELTTELTLINDSLPSNTPDKSGSAVLLCFDMTYSYSWQYTSSDYQDSGTAVRNTKPFITLEKSGGEWYIRNLSFSLDNGSM